MAIGVVVSTLAGDVNIALDDGATVSDAVNDDRVTGYSADKVVRVNNENATLSDSLEEGDVISFASPDYKHGNVA